MFQNFDIVVYILETVDEFMEEGCYYDKCSKTLIIVNLSSNEQGYFYMRVEPGQTNQTHK
jgi:hypothetical protein